MTRYTVAELYQPPVAKLHSRRPVELLWGVFENGRVIAAFASFNRADSYARKLNAWERQNHKRSA